ncbi:MAG: type I-E CRISPR-associated protein Cse2/CasB [Burkholderiales bacterium]|nr:type I-E CRISPR-associated protein Cse2/CasB [Burkholderiales bacterium]
MSVAFRADQRLGTSLLEWWRHLDDDRASRAVLRRASSVTDVSLSAAYQHAYRRLRGAGWPADARSFQNDRLAAVIGLLAHVENDDKRSLPQAMSTKSSGEGRVSVSELRFRRLLEAPDIDTLFVGLRRALPLVSHSVGVLALANDVLMWGDAVKKQWAYGYDWPENEKA